MRSYLTWGETSDRLQARKWGVTAVSSTFSPSVPGLYPPEAQNIDSPRDLSHALTAASRRLSLLFFLPHSKRCVWFYLWCFCVPTHLTVFLQTSQVASWLFAELKQILTRLFFYCVLHLNEWEWQSSGGCGSKLCLRASTDALCNEEKVVPTKCLHLIFKVHYL